MIWYVASRPSLSLRTVMCLDISLLNLDAAGLRPSVSAIVLVKDAMLPQQIPVMKIDSFEPNILHEGSKLKRLHSQTEHDRNVNYGYSMILKILNPAKISCQDQSINRVWNFFSNSP